MNLVDKPEIRIFHGLLSIVVYDTLYSKQDFKWRNFVVKFIYSVKATNYLNMGYIFHHKKSPKTKFAAKY